MNVVKEYLPKTNGMKKLQFNKPELRWNHHRKHKISGYLKNDIILSVKY